MSECNFLFLLTQIFDHLYELLQVTIRHLYTYKINCNDYPSCYIILKPRFVDIFTAYTCIIMKYANNSDLAKYSNDLEYYNIQFNNVIWKRAIQPQG